jgi:hypothetical protein
VTIPKHDPLVDAPTMSGIVRDARRSNSAAFPETEGRLPSEISSRMAGSAIAASLPVFVREFALCYWTRKTTGRQTPSLPKALARILPAASISTAIASVKPAGRNWFRSTALAAVPLHTMA